MDAEAADSSRSERLKRMPHLVLFAPNAARREGLLEQLSRWPELKLTTIRTLAELKEQLASRPEALLLDPEEALDPALYKNVRHLCLGPGGDMPRPLRWSQLASRLALLLGRYEAEEEFMIGDFTCQPVERTLIDASGAEHARLTDKEVHLLRMLNECGPQGMGRDELLEKVWGYREGLDTHTLETHIYRLRQKLEADPANPQLLLTTSGGYKLAEG